MAPESTEIIKIIQGYYQASRDSEKRAERLARSKVNNAAFRGEFDFTAKVEGQSSESLPKVTTAVESFAAFIRQGLAQFGEWFRVEMPEDPHLSPPQVSAILKEYLREMPDGVGGVKSIEQVISDGAKIGALDSLVIFKVHGAKRPAGTPPGIKLRVPEQWRLSIDAVPIEDYYPDPTTRRLYEIHRKQVDLFEVKKMAEAGVYDKREVGRLTAAAAALAADKASLARDEGREAAPSGRAVVEVMECYGTLVDFEGECVGENHHAVIANDSWLLRKPRPIEQWCGAPFAVGPLTRVPHSVWHRAPMDHVSALNQALNELYNLIFDAGISAVHGVKEIRLNWLEDATAIAGGIAPQQTIAINDTAPPGVSAINITPTGRLPGEVLGLLALVEREILEAAMTNELKIGGLPPKQVLATEIIQSQAATSTLLSAVLSEYDEVLSTTLTKAWQLIMQNARDLRIGTVVRAIGEERARALSAMDDEERYRRYVKDTQVIVTGISGVGQKSQELHKLLAVLGALRSDPLLLEQYGKRVSGEKLFKHLFALASVDVATIERTEEELQAITTALRAEHRPLAPEAQGRAPAPEVASQQPLGGAPSLTEMPPGIPLQ